jgi:hypothetical protein
LPAGTKVSTERINGRSYTSCTRWSSVTIPAGTRQPAWWCARPLDTGSAFNLPAGYFCILPTAVNGIERVANPVDWLIRARRRRSKDDEALALRIQNQYSVVGRYHIDAVYRSACSPAVAGIRADQHLLSSTTRRAGPVLPTPTF